MTKFDVRGAVGIWAQLSRSRALSSECVAATRDGERKLRLLR